MKTKSFTLIELLVVIVIIGILAGVITLSVSSNISKAQDLKVSSTILSVSKALKADSYDSFPIETTACNLKNSCTTLKARIDLPNITEDIYYKSSSSGKFFVIYANKPSNTSLGFEITSIDENVKEVPSFDNLVAYYPLTTGTANGTAISDMSPNSNNGTNYGASSATGADGNIGTAMSFDGTNDYIDCGNDSSLNILNDITISFWINVLDYNFEDSAAHIFGNGESSIVGYNIWLYRGGYMHYRTNQGGAEQITSSYAGFILANSWTNVIITRAGNNTSIYINGIDKTNSRGVHLNPALSTKNTFCGCYTSNGSYAFKGGMSDVRIYNRALSQEEISLLYNK